MTNRIDLNAQIYFSPPRNPTERESKSVVVVVMAVVMVVILTRTKRTEEKKKPNDRMERRWICGLRLTRPGLVGGESRGTGFNCF